MPEVSLNTRIVKIVKNTWGKLAIFCIVYIPPYVNSTYRFLRKIANISGIFTHLFFAFLDEATPDFPGFSWRFVSKAFGSFGLERFD